MGVPGVNGMEYGREIEENRKAVNEVRVKTRLGGMKKKQKEESRSDLFWDNDG